MKEKFQVVFSGNGVEPESMSAIDLAEQLIHFERAIMETLKHENIKPPKNDTVLSLVSLDIGSSILTYSINRQCILGIKLIVDYLDTHDPQKLPDSAIKELKELTDKNISKNRNFTIQENNSIGLKSVKISSENPLPEPAALKEIRGHTAIFGKCVRVGGATNTKASIILNNKKLLIIELSVELAKEIGRHLYEDIVVEGTATWNAKDWSILRFRATSLTKYRITDSEESFATLARMSDGTWDDVDAEDFVNSLRYDSDELN